MLESLERCKRKETLYKISLAVEPQNPKADIPISNSIISISVNNFWLSL